MREPIEEAQKLAFKELEELIEDMIPKPSVLSLAVRSDFWAWHLRWSPRQKQVSREVVRSILMKYGNHWNFDKDSNTFRISTEIEDDLLALFSHSQPKVKKVEPTYCFCPPQQCGRCNRVIYQSRPQEDGNG